MSVNADEKNPANSESRALVATEARREPASGVYHADAPFIVQLSANVKGFSQYRAKRRAQPEVAAMRYRTAISDALACQPKGKKLNYCA